MECGFYESKRGWGRERCEGKTHWFGAKNSYVVDEYAVKNSGSNDVNTPTVNLEKLLEPNIGAHINDATSVEVSATSNSTPITSASMPESISFAGKLKGDLTRKSVNFLNLVTSARNEANVDISLEAIRVISEQFANTAYGFFLGKWVAYPVVANYVRNIWSKYGRVKSMLNSSNGLFFFQFSY
nr:hypothetical protein [Tanacetum cinerariifolium]